MKGVKLEGIVYSLDNNINSDDFLDEFIDFVESKKLYFGGGVDEINNLKEDDISKVILNIADINSKEEIDKDKEYKVVVVVYEDREGNKGSYCDVNASINEVLEDDVNGLKTISICELKEDNSLVEIYKN